MTTAATSDDSVAPQARAGGPELYAGAVVFSLGLCVRLWLIHLFPVIFGGDSIVRLANKDRILLSYQLPLLQAVIHWLSAWSNDPIIVRCFMALAGAAAGLAFYALACSLLGRTAGLQTGLLFASSPFVIAFSIVPYQEILMLAGLFAAFYFAFDRKWIVAAACLGLACLTRYEAWLACPVLGVAYLAEKDFRPLEIAKAAALFGSAPLGWMVFHGGVTPEGTYAAEASFSFERFFRYLYLGWITVKNTPPPVLLLAVAGAWMFWKRRLIGDPRYRMLLSFLLLFLAAVLVSAHGERDQPERFVTAREAHVLLAATILAAGLGLASFDAKWTNHMSKSNLTESAMNAPTLPACRWVFVVGSCLIGTWMAYGFVANEASQPPFALSFEVARYLDEHVGSGESAVVLAQPVPKDLLSRYLDKAEQSGGRAGRQKALEVLLDLDNSPPNYQRILVHSRLTKQQLQSVSSLPEDLVPRRASTIAPPDWLVVWSDFLPTNPIEENLRDRISGNSPEKVYERGELRVAIYRLR